MKSSALIVSAAALMIAFSSAATADDADILREAKDRAEIEELMWRYTRALDTGDAEAYAATYTEDGQFGTGPNATKGHAALKAMIEGVGGGGGGPQMLYHMTANSHIEFIDEDNARLHAYYITTAPANDGNPSRIVAIGRSVDTLVRTSDGWRIRIRDVQPQD